MRRKQKPTCFIIAGPNGAGKTTFALRYLPQIAGCRNFVDADLIAHALSPFDSLSAQHETGRLFLREVRANIDKRVDSAFETTLAGRSQINLAKKLKRDGWQVVLFFLWIPDVTFSQTRVRKRAEHGGPDIPDNTIYHRSPCTTHNLMRICLPLCDKTICCDNSGPKPIPVFQQYGRDRRIFVQDIYESIARQSHDYKATQ